MDSFIHAGSNLRSSKSTGSVGEEGMVLFYAKCTGSKLMAAEAAVLSRNFSTVRTRTHATTFRRLKLIDNLF